MSVGMDGVVWVECDYTGGRKHFINAAYITRAKDLSREECVGRSIKYPAIMLSLVGMTDDVTVSNVTAEEFKEKVDKAVAKHYNDIAERALGVL